MTMEANWIKPDVTFPLQRHIQKWYFHILQHVSSDNSIIQSGTKKVDDHDVFEHNLRAAQQWFHAYRM